MEVTAAHVGVNAQVVRQAIEHAVVDVEELALDALDSCLVRSKECGVLGVDQTTPAAVIELQVAAARVVNLSDKRLVGDNDICGELFIGAVEACSRLAIHRHDELLDKLSWRRNRQLCDRLLILLCSNKTIMVNKGMLARQLNAPGDKRVIDLCRLVVERQAVYRRRMADAVEAPHKIEMPCGATELPVGDNAQAGSLLFCDQIEDALVLGRLESVSADLTCLELLARLFKTRGAQKTADNIKTVRGLFIVCDSHGNSLLGTRFVTSTQYESVHGHRKIHCLWHMP